MSGRETSTKERSRPPIADQPGTYALRLRCAGSVRIRVGALGRMTTREGAYIYVGSAFGPGGVEARVRRHRKHRKPDHWHVDYLREVAELREVWATYDPARRECEWARIFAGAPDSTVPLRGLGASDCSCPGHLFQVPTDLGWRWFRRRVPSEIPDHDPVHRSLERARPRGEPHGRAEEPLDQTRPQPGGTV